MCTLRFETKLWMVNEKGEAVFGDGLAELLEEIRQTPLNFKAAEDLGMSYRYALHRITLAEERLGATVGYTSSWGSEGRWFFRSYGFWQRFG